MKRALVLFVLLVTVAMGTAFAKPSKADLENAAGKILDALSQFPETDLSSCTSTYNAVIDKINTVSKLKSMADVYKSYRDMIQTAKEYKYYKAGNRDGDLERCRNKLLKQTASFVETVASNGMGNLQGGIMSLAIQSCINAIDAIAAYNARWQWLDAVSLTDYYNLAAPPYDKYASTAWQMYSNGQNLETIKFVLDKLVAIETHMSKDATVTTYTPRKTYKIGDSGPGKGLVFRLDVDATAGMECTVNRGNADWKTALKWENDIKNNPINGKNDWRLPSPGELDLIYRVKDKLRGTWYPESYWAKKGNSGLLQNFANGGVNNNPDLSLARHVIFVRNF